MLSPLHGSRTNQRTTFRHGQLRNALGWCPARKPWMLGGKSETTCGL